MTQYYLYSLIGILVLLTIQGSLLVIQLWLFRKSFRSRDSGLTHYVYAISFIFMLPVTMALSLIFFIGIRNIYNDVKPNGFYAQMLEPVPQSLLNDLCDWEWINTDENNCSHQSLNHAQVVEILRSNIEDGSEDNVMKNLNEYWLSCYTVREIYYCSGRISKIAYQLKFENNTIKFRQVNDMRRSS